MPKVGYEELNISAVSRIWTAIRSRTQITLTEKFFKEPQALKKTLERKGLKQFAKLVTKPSFIKNSLKLFKVQVRGYKRDGKLVRGYVRSYNKWTPERKAYVRRVLWLHYERTGKLNLSPRELMKLVNKKFEASYTYDSVRTLKRRIIAEWRQKGLVPKNVPTR